MNVGGPAHQATLLTHRLDPARFTTTLVSGAIEPHEADLPALFGTTRPHLILATLHRAIAPVHDLRTLIALIRLLRRIRPHIVHTHLAKAGLLGRIAARLAGVPIVIHTFHGNVLQGYFGRAVSFVFLTLERFLARLTTSVVAISDGQAAEIERLGIARGTKLVRIPLGLDLLPFLNPPIGRLRQELGLSVTDPLVGIVARLVPIKSVEVFVDAAARLRESNAGITFVVVGDGELRGKLEQQAGRLGVAGAVHFLGWRADLAAIYADLDILVLTSRNEGTPVSIIEAMASARAVVATRVGGVPDLLESPECGITVPRGDSAAVADAIRVLLADPDRRARLGAAGRQRVYPEFDISTLVRRIEALYEQLLHHRVRSGSQS